MSAIPLLFFGDSPSLHTGLARIGRDLACRICTLPEFRVGFLGKGGIPKRKLPFMQYTFPESAQWGEGYLEAVWKDFSGGQNGIIFTIWDASRLLWFSQPRPEMGPLYKFLSKPNFQRWGYFPIDATGPGGQLSAMSVAAIVPYERTLAYTEWASTVLTASGITADWLPHGLDLTLWQPRDRVAARIALHCEASDIVIGMNATNQSRKDWGCAFAAISELRKHHDNLKFWCHTDSVSGLSTRDARPWDFNALTADYGLQDTVIVTLGGTLTDTELSYYYSACDLTILPSAEGFGYPIVESLACGVPCIHSSYGGGAELVPEAIPVVHPIAWRLDTPYNCLRPVFDPQDWVQTIEKVLQLSVSAEQCRAAVEHLSWPQLWESRWKKWFLEGAKC